MFDEFSSRTQSDFQRARFKAFINGVVSTLSGQSNRLLNYDEIKEKLHIGGPIYRGVQTVPISKISGSLNRYHDFDRTFLPKKEELSSRWQRIKQAWYQDISLPPVILYKVGEVYFVVDGHHRLSVAREQGQQYIEADVRECSSKVKISSDLRPEDLEILGEKVDFIERTRLDVIRPEANIILNIPDGFNRILEHIAVHRYFMGLDMKREVSEEEAVSHWYDAVYLPIILVIRQSRILEEFQNRTEGDLYLWVLDHQHDLIESGHEMLPPDKAAQEFLGDLNE